MFRKIDTRERIECVARALDAILRSVAATHWGALRIDEAKLIYETDDGKRLLSYSIDGAQ